MAGHVTKGYIMEFPVLGFIFWAGVFIWLSVVAWSRYLKEVERQKTLRAFAERGQPLDRETLEKLLPRSAFENRNPQSPETTARGLMIGGIVTAFAAVGLAIGAQIIGQMEWEALWGMSGAAAIVGFTGFGLITSSIFMRRQAAADRKALLDPADRGR
ncbi:MAG: hypothetical protein ABW278_08690 [Steroidobacteraceae bacterium]